jgi:hypothetical protein
MWLKSCYRDLSNHIRRAKNGASMSTQWHLIFFYFFLPRFSLLPRQLIASLFLGHWILINKKNGIDFCTFELICKRHAFWLLTKQPLFLIADIYKTNIQKHDDVEIVLFSKTFLSSIIFLKLYQIMLFKKNTIGLSLLPN